jgi:hypothetical protein
VQFIPLLKTGRYSTGDQRAQRFPIRNIHRFIARRAPWNQGIPPRSPNLCELCGLLCNLSLASKTGRYSTGDRKELKDSRSGNIRRFIARRAPWKQDFPPRLPNLCELCGLLCNLSFSSNREILHRRSQRAQRFRDSVLVVTSHELESPRRESVRLWSFLSDINMPMDIVVVPFSRFEALRDKLGIARQTPRASLTIRHSALARRPPGAGRAQTFHRLE